MPARPTASGMLFLSRNTMSGQSRLFQYSSAKRMNMVARPGRRLGSAMLQKMRYSLAPSTRAESIISSLMLMQ
jgi:hypothetical protein